MCKKIRYLVVCSWKLYTVIFTIDLYIMVVYTLESDIDVYLLCWLVMRSRLYGSY